MVKEFLLQRGVAFEERDVSRNRSYAQELMKNTGQMGVPVTIIDGQIVIGFNQSRIEEILNQAQKKSHPFGASVVDANKVTINQSPEVTYGAFVGRVRPNSVAERTGLVYGDIIIEINSKRIGNVSDLEHVLDNLNVGEHFSLVFVRSGKTMTTEGMF